MTTIKLNRYYPHLTENITLEVSDEIAVVLSTGGCQCDSYKRRKREHNECSLDVDPGFEPDVMFPPLTPEEIILDEETVPSSTPPLTVSRPSRPGECMPTTFWARKSPRLPGLKMWWKALFAAVFAGA